jgi:hypothetical protein
LRHLPTLILVALPTVGLAFLIATCVPGGGPLRALATVAALATPLWTYATVFFGHAPAAILVTIAWASSLVLRLPRRWVATIFAATLAAQLLWLSWQGARPGAEIEPMCAQVLRRLGHIVVADRIERSFISDPTSARN